MSKKTKKFCFAVINTLPRILVFKYMFIGEQDGSNKSQVSSQGSDGIVLIQDGGFYYRKDGNKPKTRITQLTAL